MYGGAMHGKESACQCKRYKRCGGLIPESGRSSGVGNGKPLQYSCLENSMDRGAWQDTVQEVQWVGHDPAHTQSGFVILPSRSVTLELLPFTSL